MWWSRTGWTTLREDGVSLEHPRTWRVKREDGHLHLSPRGKSVHLMVAAFRKTRGSLDELVEAKLAADADTFPALGPRVEKAGRNWTGIRHEADDVRPDREVDTRRVVVCAARGDLYVTLSLYLDPDEFSADRATYERVLGSLELTK